MNVIELITMNNVFFRDLNIERKTVFSLSWKDRSIKSTVSINGLWSFLLIS